MGRESDNILAKFWKSKRSQRYIYEKFVEKGS